MSDLVDIETVQPFDVWGESVRARKIEGERMTLAVVELTSGAVVPEHRHEAEQLGLCIEGEVTFTVDGETRRLGPGGTWRVRSNLPHSVQAGPEGAIVVDVFAPIRDDWGGYELLAPRSPRWPRR